MNKKTKILMAIHLRQEEINIIKVIIRLLFNLIGSDRNRCNRQNNDNGKVKKFENICH